jgi:hypothetical protein
MGYPGQKKARDDDCSVCGNGVAASGISAASKGKGPKGSVAFLITSKSVHALHSSSHACER